VARYGEEAGRLEVGGRSGSFWWREIAKIRDGIGDLDGGWFIERVSKRVGDDNGTFFWYNRWLGDVSLRTRFSRLFELSNNKLCTVADMFRLGWEAGERRGVGEGCGLERRSWWRSVGFFINDIVLQSDISDRWQWNPDIQGGYTVSGAYQILTTPNDIPPVGVNDLIWHKQVPLKVSIFAWRLLRDRLPTKINLVRRGLINAETVGYVAGCGGDETTSLLFFSLCQLWLFMVAHQVVDWCFRCRP